MRKKPIGEMTFCIPDTNCGRCDFCIAKGIKSGDPVKPVFIEELFKHN